MAEQATPTNDPAQTQTPPAATAAPTPPAGTTLATAPNAAATQTPDAAAGAEALAAREAEEAARVESDRVAKLTPEQKAAEDAAKNKPQSAPEKYEFKPPEGVTLDAEVTTAFEAKAKKLGLSQSDAQELFDIGAKAVTKNSAQFQKQITETQASWLAAAKADKEFGGGDEAVNKNMAVAKRALDAFATPDLRTMLEDTRLGNHPEVIRLLYRVGKAMSEDKFIPGSAVAQPRDTSDEARAKRLYPNTKPSA